LDGSLRPATLVELARETGVALPNDIRFKAGMGLQEALARFEVTVACLQTPDAVRRVAREMCEDAQAEGISTLEIRFAPQLHRGAAIEAVVDAALEGVRDRAGLILCALYGEPPALVERLVEVAAARAGVVGLDLAGGPIPSHRWSMSDYAPAFRRARDHGLGRTVHAGEGRPAQEIVAAIEQLHAMRIGHACTVMDDPQVVDLLLEREITIEACPTSNVHTGIYKSVLQHPLPLWLDRGLKVTVCTDNTLLSDVDLPTEIERALAIEGMSAAKMNAVTAHGHAAAFGAS
jgi:adenosine deaminase